MSDIMWVRKGTSGFKAERKTGLYSRYVISGEPGSVRHDFEVGDILRVRENTPGLFVAAEKDLISL
jgi:hypothetical protein